jgi:hypothetical protein
MVPQEQRGIGIDLGKHHFLSFSAKANYDKPGAVVRAFNPSYSGDRGKRIVDLETEARGLWI